MVPRPITGGGGNITTKASCNPAYFWFSRIAMAPAERSGVVRWSKGLSPAKTMPELELLVKPLIDRPGNEIACSTPGSSRAIWLIVRITSSERSSVAPSGSWAKPIRYCLSCIGTKPPGTTWNNPQAAPTRARYIAIISDFRPSTRATPLP